MTSFGIVIITFFAGVLGFKAFFSFMNLLVQNQALKIRVNTLESKYGEKVTDFSDDGISVKPQEIPKHNYHVPPEKPKPLIEADVLMFMIKRCHSDYVQDADKKVVAEKATNWLLAQKKKQKQEGF